MIIDDEISQIVEEVDNSYQKNDKKRLEEYLIMVAADLGNNSRIEPKPSIISPYRQFSSIVSLSQISIRDEA